MANNQRQIDSSSIEIDNQNQWELKDFIGAVDVPESLKNRIGKMINGEFQAEEVISGLSKINILVGANNSGKSYIMREILKSDLQLNYFAEGLTQEYNRLIGGFRTQFENIIDDYIKTRGGKYAQQNIFFMKAPKGQFSKQELLLSMNPIQVGVSMNRIQQIIKSYKSVFDSNTAHVELSLADGAQLLSNRPGGNALYNQFTKLLGELTEKLNSPKFHGRQLFNGKGDTDKLPRIYFIEHRSLLRKERQSIMELDIKNEFSFDFQMYYKFFRDIDNHFTDIDRGKFQQHGVWPLKNQIQDAPQGNIQYNDILIIRNGYYIYEDLASWFNSADGLKRLWSYQEFLSQEFFQGKEVMLIPARDKAEILIKIGNEPDLEIYHLGTGLQMMIMFTLPLFQHDKGIFFIEEPELFMHPGMQRHLMSIFATHPRTKNFVFFMTTHSNHIIDASIGRVIEDISIFTVRKFSAKNDIGEEESKFSITKLAQGNQDALSLLGVLNSSVYLANCTIWVEGISDKRYITAFLDAFVQYLRTNRDKTDLLDVQEFRKCLSYREGTHYAFVFSGGNNIVHWNFDEDADWEEHIENPVVRDICGRALVIVDRDTQKDGTSKAPKRKERLEQLLGERFIELSVREIENLLPLAAIEEAIHQYRGLSHFVITDKDKQNLKQRLLTEQIGKFLNKLVKDEQGTKPNFAATSGTINDKQTFCDRIIKTRKINWDNMPEEAKKLVKEIFRFIQVHNPK